MENNEFLSALSEVCESGLLSEADTELPKGFKFSKGFERKMNEITGRGRIHIRKRLKLAFFAAALLAVGFMLGMAARPKWGYVSKPLDEGMLMTFDVSSVENPKTAIDEKYTLAGIPEGLEADEPWIDSPYCLFNSWGKYNDGRFNIEIVFGQYIPAAYRNVYISERDKRYLVTEENGIQYFVLVPDENEKYVSVVWYQNGYVFMAGGEMPKDDIINLCKTLKLEES